jgi:two-component system, sensor histidine kinase and response regulator
MRGAHFVILVCLFFLNPHLEVLGQNFHAQDSIAILNQDSLAYKIFLSKPDSSIAMANRALNKAISIKSTYLEGYGYFILSKTYWAKANYRLSTEFGFKALRIFENTVHTELWGESLLSLARTCIDLRDFDKARGFIKQSISIAQEHNDNFLLAVAYREKSMLLSEVKEYDSAHYYSDKGIALFEGFGDSLNAGILYGRKAKIYFHQKNFTMSSLYNKKSILIDSLVQNRRALAITYYQASLDAIHLNQFDSAVYFLKKSIPINHEINNLGSLIKVHKLLADIYLEQNKPLLAAQQLKLVSQYKDSLYNAEKSGQIQEMQTLYELATKEKTIGTLEQENALKLQQMKNQRLALALLVACILLLVSLVFFLTRLRKIQAKTNSDLASKNIAIEHQKEEILSQAETLQQLNQLKLKLFSVISHDVRGPISTLHALLDLLTRKGVTQEEFILISDKLKTNLTLTQRTLENLLNWSLSQMEGLRTQPKVINIKSAIDDVNHLMEETALKKNIKLENQSENAIEVKADPNQLQLILRNLVHNAIKFSKPNHNVLIFAKHDDDNCFITIKDFGIGMTPGEVKTVLDSRNHFSKAGTDQEKGTGLGLLLCKEFIKHNGGDFNISSIANEGTEVQFSLPLAESTVPK